MLTGLHAFPLTPFVDDVPDEARFARLIGRLSESEVDAVTVLGSTGSYAYLNRAERRRLLEIAVDHAGGLPVAAGIGALRTSEVLGHLQDAQDAGVCAVLLAPMTYQPLTDDEVLGLFSAVCAEAEVPVVIYDNPTTTGFRFHDHLYARIAETPGIGSVKIPPTGPDPTAARARIDAVRSHLPAHVTIGISGDSSAAAALTAGCDAWYSVAAGTVPELCAPIMRAARAGDEATCLAASQALEPLWSLYAECGGSLRAVAALAEHLGLVGADCLPSPMRGLTSARQAQVADAAAALGLTSD